MSFLTYDTEDLIPAGEWLASHIPGRVRPPGDVAGYSNYNADLAGYIVARLSGIPYDQYIQENILDPLGMADTSVRSPVPADLMQRMSKAYLYQDGALQEDPFYHAQPAIMPGAGLTSTATDMARFMIAHLQNGRYGEARILEENTAQQMHRETLFIHDPGVLGINYGFVDMTDSGQFTIGHYGGADPMFGGVFLLPDQNLGVYFSANSMGGQQLITYHYGFQKAFFDHYYPADVAPIVPPSDFVERAGRFTGSYKYTFFPYTTPEKFKDLTIPFKISDPDDGTLLFATPYGEYRYVEVEPLYFRDVDNENTMVFREDDQGRITHAFVSIVPYSAFEKMSWYETPDFNMGLALGCALIFLSLLIAAPISAIRDRRQGGDWEPAPRGARRARWIIVGISILNLLFLVGTMLWGDPAVKPLFGVPLNYRLVLGLGVLAAVLTVGALVFTFLAWKDSYWGIAWRVYYTLVDTRGGRFRLVPEPLEPAGLAVLAVMI